MPDRLIIIRQPSALRNVTDAEVRAAIPDDLLRLPQESVEVDMRPFQNDTQNGHWDEAEGYIIDQARRIRKLAERADDPALLYFGLANVPLVLALGAYVGDERYVDVHDYDRDADSWAWPENVETVSTSIIGLPADRVEASGEAVLRVAVSYDVTDANVDAVVATGRLADVTIRSNDPRPTAVRSAADVASIRRAFRDALGKLIELRPRLDRVHLFVAAPVSVCFVIGQELRLRSGVPVVTYQYRPRTDGPNHREAIMLTPGEASAAARLWTNEERATAQTIRTGVWPLAVSQVVHYARTREEDVKGQARRWYSPFLFGDKLCDPDPLPALPPLWSVADTRMTVSEAPLVSAEPYALPKEGWAWQLTDDLLLSQQRTALTDDSSLDEALLARMVRLFVFHESVHNHHSLSKYTAVAVGRFANCLERLDYMADLYAALHELDYAARFQPGLGLTSDEARHEELKRILDVILRSHWAFVAQPPVTRWQARHVRRFLNWYWRRVQVVRAPSLDVALRVLSEPPAVEIAGFEYTVGGPRVYVHLDRPDPSAELALGLVAENAQFVRVVDSVNANLSELARAFSGRDHEAIKRFFQTVYEEAEQVGGALPTVSL